MDRELSSWKVAKEQREEELLAEKKVQSQELSRLKALAA
jgi:hypothetical protein